VRELLGHRDGRIYLAGQSLSIAGSNALWLAMAIWTKMLTGSNSAAGLTFFAYVCGALCAPVGGMLADRVRRRPLLIVANLSGGAWVCALLLVRHDLVWLIYLVMFGYGMVGSLITSAQSALLAVMLPERLLGEANAVLQIAEIGLRVVTPLISAGLLASAGPVPVIALDAGTFLLAGLAVAATRPREPPPAAARGRWSSEFTAGIRHIGRTSVLRRLTVAGVIALMAFGFFQTVPFAVVGQGLHRSPSFLGVLESVMGAGALAGGVLVSPVLRRLSEQTLVAVALVIGTLACVLLASGVLPVVLLAMGLVGLCIIWANVGLYTAIQRNTPQELIGRVDAALNTAIMIPQAASIALGAGLVSVVDYRILLVAMAATFMVSAAEIVVPSSTRADVTARPADEPGGG
jgi:MFS family permease